MDLDAGVSTNVETTGDSGPKDEQAAGIEVEYRPNRHSCGVDNSPSVIELRSVTGRQVGVLRADQPHDFESCRAAAGTGFGPVSPGNGRWTDRGLVEGAALCSVTDKGAVAMAVLEKVGENESAPTVTGKLVVWSKD
ncbi:hypothetical protein [Streptomyces sp. NPDC048603]|uniref:hypothetical protein n=1 Tax=Streptomyces sp. NPDC048603 TaxID=3365577 RepID=UPI003720EE2B